MAGYADSSFLVSSYTPDANSTEALEEFDNAGAAFWLTPFGEFEFTNALELRVFPREITPSQAQASVADFMSDIGVLFIRKPIPPAAFERALALSRRHTRKTGVRSLDILHVAIAAELKAAAFFTFDRNQRKLARAAGLKVRPSR